MRQIFRAWWPLTLSWLCLTFEQVLVTFAITRMDEPGLQIAIFAGTVCPIICLLESPIYALLSTANTLCRDRESYHRAFRYSLVPCLISFGLAVLLLVPPVFDFVMRDLLNAPSLMRTESYRSFVILMPTGILVGLRRFFQGIMVRLGFPHLVGRGSVLRIGSMIVFLVIFSKGGWVSGSITGALALLLGVSVEAIYAVWMAKRLMPLHLPPVAANARAVTAQSFTRFYWPLALTALLYCLVPPIITGAINRSPRPLDSLVVWPVVWQLILILATLSAAFPDITVTFLSSGTSRRLVEQFIRRVTIGSVVLAAALLFSPLATLWFGRVMKLSPDLAALAWYTFLLVGIVPALSCRASELSGRFLFSHVTFPIIEGAVAYLIFLFLSLLLGVAVSRYLDLSGALACSVGAVFAAMAQVVWLQRRAKVFCPNSDDTPETTSESASD